MGDAIPPILIDEQGDIEVYPSIAEAALQLEAVDVIDGVYEAFDSEGRQLELLPQGTKVLIQSPPDSKPNPIELERRVRWHIDRVGNDLVGVDDLDVATLPSMIEALLRFQRPPDERRRRFGWFRQ